MSDHYRMLKDGTTEVVEDLMEWAKGMQTCNRQIANVEADGVRVSTVFLGLNYQYGKGPPLLFETMVFGGEHDEDCDRYSTVDKALAGHCRMATEALGPNWNKAKGEAK